MSTSADFEVLALALEAADLTGTVQGLTDVTIFAPTDAAFAGLAQDLGFTGDTGDATAVFGAVADALSGLASDGDPIPLLTDILLYHVAPGTDAESDLNAGGPLDTLLAGTPLQITGGTVVDNDTNSLNADIIAPDIATTGGNVQVVDQVLLPIETPAEIDGATLLDTLKESGGTPDEDATDFDLLLTALQATGLDAAVDDPEAELTVFLPNDGAFVSLAQNLGYEGEDEGEALQTILDASAAADPDNPLQLVTDILTYHVSPGVQDATAVLGSTEIATLNGAEIGVSGTTLVDLEPDAEDPEIIATDLTASNGIAHVIDEVLLPLDLPAIDMAALEMPAIEIPAEEEDPEEEAEHDDGFDFPIEALGFGALMLLILAGGGA
ncbi:fasciclin domain-containing protein [Candidatus Rhodobacter oscarellae]|uniref:fasciclin domain-containing protein n=1 Tax=Candidatus Rhodobacter oscarellae TaxID=1675527 RepID=UPI001F175097|nr:fasciclin domain-containing protein [Candidatus Rhodobacter lobularis]